MNMKRTQMYIPHVDMDKMKKLAEEQQITISELVRRLIANYLQKVSKNEK